MFSINNYDLTLSFSLIAFFFCFFYVVFLRLSTSLLDPLNYHLLWISTIVTFPIVYCYRYGFSLIALYFFSSMLFYFIMLRFFINYMDRDCNNNHIVFMTYFPYKKAIKLWFYLSLLLAFSKLSMFEYMIENPIIKWPLYRYIDLQGRNPLERILSTAIPPFFIMFSLAVLLFYKRNKLLIVTSIFFYLTTMVLGGGRSSLIGLAFSVGLFLFFFKGAFSKRNIYLANVTGALVLVFSLILAIVVTSFLVSDIDPVYLILNRIMANADGLEYYLKYDGFSVLPSSLIKYLESVLGLFLKPLLGDIKNVGWLLSEAAVGSKLDFAQGANFILPLQAMVFPFYLGLFYIAFIAASVAFFRCISFSSRSLLPYAYFLSSSSFIMATDIEYWVFVIFSGSLFFVFIMFPAIKVIK